MQTFGGTKNVLPHALTAWEGRAEAEEAGREADALLAQLLAAPEVPVAPYADGPQVMSVVRRALARVLSQSCFFWNFGACKPLNF